MGKMSENIDLKRQMNFVERMIGRETPDFRFSSFSDWWNEVADVRTDSFDWWYVTGVSAFLVLYWLLFIVGVIQLACDSSRGGKLRRAEEEAEQRNRRTRTQKMRSRRLFWTPPQFKCRDRRHWKKMTTTQKRSRHFGLKILFDKLGSQEPYKLSLPPGR